MIKYLLLDVSGTLLYKPTLYKNIQEVLEENNVSIDIEKIKYHHKILSEIIKFPDRTDVSFYKQFNSEFLISLGIVPTEELLLKIFEKCTYLPWEKYEDTTVLEKINLPIGILSNFNSTLEEKLKSFFSIKFKNVFTSEVIEKSKPSLDFYKHALKEINLKPQEILYIGDSYKLDFIPAQQLGIKALIIDREEVYIKSDNKISSLNEIEKYIK